VSYAFGLKYPYQRLSFKKNHACVTVARDDGGGDILTMAVNTKVQP
jgi:hypothetical protein